MAVNGRTSVQEVDTDRLKAKLLAQKAVLDPAAVPVPETPGGGEKLAAVLLKGIVVDDKNAKVTGEWKESRSVGKYVGDGYLHDDNADKGKKSVRFTPKLPGTGAYEVFLHYTPASNRATNVPVIVHCKTGEKTVTVDQKKDPGPDGSVSLGTFPFDAGESGWVEVRTTDSNGYVVADAVRFVEK
jgi:hypothetical protein